MRYFRVVLIVVVLVNAALTAVYLELASVRLRYECVKKEEQVRRLVLERRMRMRELAEARTTASLLRSAERFGIRVRQARHEDMAPAGRAAQQIARGGARR